ncbi:HrpF/NolX family T3SS translocon protein [Pokkaliibacter sp. CJK22405]|uniref:HrpF/NolX family T3SS translocon protein n=1 Tax=Pokkaliibacter sp. CJK22405 TaxID=3384615 RepID=UPI003984BCC1
MQVSNFSGGNQPPIGGDKQLEEGLKLPLLGAQKTVVQKDGITWGSANSSEKNPPAEATLESGDASELLQALFGGIKSLMARREGQQADGTMPQSSTQQLPVNKTVSTLPQTTGQESLVPVNRQTDTGTTQGDTQAAATEGDTSAAANGEDAPMSFEEIVTTLGRHEDLLKKPKDFKGLQELANDPDTPSDAKKALEALTKDGEDGAMYQAFDAAKTGKTDGKISSKDIRELQKLPQVAAYADFKAETYTHDYVPSDAKPGSAPREMTTNDAMRELFQYSESLPGKNIDLETMQKIADGTQDMGKCPPQVAAAAKFFTDHPDQWQILTKDDGGKVSRDRLCDLAAQNVNLSPQESKAIDTLQNNKDIFFKGGSLNTDKLTKIANDESNSQDVRDAANLLAQPHSMLFSMLDNGKHGAGGNFFNKANDKKISEGDLSAFVKKGTNQVAQEPILSGAPTNKLEADAINDMNVGQETQPDEKKEKGGGIFKLLEALSWVGTAVASVFTGGAAGALMTAGRVIGQTVAKVVAKEVGKEVLEQGAKGIAKEAGKDIAKEVGKDAAKDIATGTVKNAAKDITKDYGKDYTQDQIARIEGDDTGIDAPRVWAQT